MDSKQIHIKAKYLLAKDNLERLPGGGWQYCGRSDDFRRKEVFDAIDQHFTGGNIYFVSTRKDSRLEPKSRSMDLIISMIDESDFALWSEDFCKVMEFKSIGVFRFGSVS